VPQNFFTADCLGDCIPHVPPRSSYLAKYRCELDQ
jgi:hypothetical protein